MASRPLKSKVSRAPVIFSEKTTENTRQDAQLRKDRTLARSLASHGRTFVKNFGTTLENLLSNLVEKDLESRGIAQDCFFRDDFAGWMLWSTTYTSILLMSTILLFSSGCSTLLSAMCVKFIELKKIRKRLFYLDTYCLKVIGQVLEAEHMKFISNISGYTMGTSPDVFEEKAKRASSTSNATPERDASVTADGDIEIFSPKSPATLRYYAARMISRLHQAPVDIPWLMLTRMVKFAIIVTGSASYRMILTVFGDAEGTIVELMGFATFAGACQIDFVFRTMFSDADLPLTLIEMGFLCSSDDSFIRLLIELIGLSASKSLTRKQTYECATVAILAQDV